jgi:hypothetical protein
MFAPSPLPGSFASTPRRRRCLSCALATLIVLAGSPLLATPAARRSTVVELPATLGETTHNSFWRTVTDGTHEWIVWEGEGLWGEGALPYAEVGAERRITFRFTVHQAGAYRLKVLNRHQREDGDNDVWGSINGSEWKKFYDWQTDQWTWDETGCWGSWRLEPGDHVLELGGRSPGFQISRLVLFCDGATDVMEWVRLPPVSAGPSTR